MTPEPKHPTPRPEVQLEIWDTPETRRRVAYCPPRHCRPPMRCRQHGRLDAASIMAGVEFEGFYTREVGKLRGHGQWRSALCPFHDDRTPSLRVNVKTGAFRCMACGASGGDVIAFVMKRHGLVFAAALHFLGE